MRCLGEREVHGEETPGGMAQLAGLRSKLGGRRVLREEPADRLLDVDARRDELPRLHLASIRQLDPDGAAVGDEDPLDVALDVHEPAVPYEVAPERVCEPVRAAEAELPVVDLADQQREADREPLGVGGIAADRRVEGEMRLDRVALEVPIEELCDRRAAQLRLEELRALVQAEGHQRLREVVDPHRWPVHERLEHQVHVAARLGLQAPEGVGVALGEARDRGMGALRVGVHAERLAVVKHARHLHLGAHVFEALLGQFQVPERGRETDEGVVVGVHVVEEARQRQLLRAEPPALLAATLEHPHREP
jgi:hypothetical protein